MIQRSVSTLFLFCLEKIEIFIDIHYAQVQWQEFRMPRTTLLSLVSDYYVICSSRLTELNKKQGQDKGNEPLDVKCNTVAYQTD